MLGIWPRSEVQDKKTCGCGGQWLPAVKCASPGRCGATAGGWNMRNPAGTAPSLCPHTVPVSHSLSLPQVLHPTASPGTNAKPVMTLRQR